MPPSTRPSLEIAALPKSPSWNSTSRVNRESEDGLSRPPLPQAKRQRQTVWQAHILKDTDSKDVQRAISQPESYDADTIVVDTSEIWVMYWVCLLGELLWWPAKFRTNVRYVLRRLQSASAGVPLAKNVVISG